MTGAYGIGRNHDWNPISVEQKLAEQFGLLVNGAFRRAAPLIKQRVIKERLSANFPTHQKGKFGGARWIKLPLSAGLRKKTGRTQRSVRVTVTTPGTNARRFRGVFNLTSKVGGGEVQWARRFENEGRLQFGRVTGEEYAKVVNEVRAGASQIAVQFGARVR